jgi:hypothetical protein
VSCAGVVFGIPLIAFLIRLGWLTVEADLSVIAMSLWSAVYYPTMSSTGVKDGTSGMTPLSLYSFIYLSIVSMLN